MKRARPDARDLARRAALNALKRARRAAARTGARLSDWEGDFLGSVEDRIKTYGRAFADPDKGAPGQSLSMLQHVKLKEITLKAKGGGKPPPGKLQASKQQMRKSQARKPISSRRGFRAGPSGGGER